MRRLSAFASVVLAAVVLLQGSPPAAAQQGFDEQEIRTLVEGLRAGTISASFASEECRAHLQESEGKDLAEVMAGYLEVPEDLALAAFCASLVQAIKSGTATLEGLLIIARQRDDPATFLEVGRLLRAIYFSHHMTTTASAEGEVRQ